ncbi:rhodanese-like domain-containing protein [Risungbinella massiliensis]|uniref:rhodanese-like domain-containing protein n=1 Tax=Risungbinella massiliensis TaxID=1329796 RepID=UPI00069B86D4|nr:rhodanese-like domain-containing protein [Risungbinella massiliensis]
MTHSIYHISPESFLDKYYQNELKDSQLIDVRETYEWDMYHIDGFQLIPLGELPDRRREIDRHKKIYLVCAHGIRSLHAANWLLEKGYRNVVNIDGGLAKVEIAAQEREEREEQ